MFDVERSENMLRAVLVKGQAGNSLDEDASPIDVCLMGVSRADGKDRSHLLRS